MENTAGSKKKNDHIDKDLLKEAEIYEKLVTVKGRNAESGIFTKAIKSAVELGIATDEKGNPFRNAEDAKNNVYRLHLHFHLRNSKGAVYRFDVEKSSHYDFATLTMDEIAISEEKFREAAQNGGLEPLRELKKKNREALEAITWINKMDNIDLNYVNEGKFSSRRNNYDTTVDNTLSDSPLVPYNYKQVRKAFDKFISEGLLYYQNKDGQWQKPGNIKDLDLANRPKMFLYDEPGGEPYLYDFDKDGNFKPSMASASKDELAEFLINENPPVQKTPWGGAQFLRSIANFFRKLFHAEELPEYREYKEAVKTFEEKKKSALETVSCGVATTQKKRVKERDIEEDIKETTERYCQRVQEILELEPEDEKGKAFLDTLSSLMGQNTTLGWGARHLMDDVVNESPISKFLSSLYKDFNPQKASHTADVLTGCVYPTLYPRPMECHKYLDKMGDDLKDKTDRLWNQMAVRAAGDRKSQETVKNETAAEKQKENNLSMNNN